MAKKRGNNRNTKAAQHVAPKMTASTPNSSAKTNSQIGFGIRAG